jgi:hypothetical protein
VRYRVGLSWDRNGRLVCDLDRIYRHSEYLERVD